MQKLGYRQNQVMEVIDANEKGRDGLTMWDIVAYGKFHHSIRQQMEKVVDGLVKRGLISKVTDNNRGDVYRRVK